MAWIILLLAGIFEVAWTIGLKYSQGFTKLGPSLWTGAALIISFALLGNAVRTLPLGTAYAIWTGIGAVGAIIAGIVLFHEPLTLTRCLFGMLIVVGMVGLKFTSGH
ncbi:DMT family transporter [Verrucomicrobium spinosum]|uniref:DMT family transporter n=1 Tax=Verrucomicrobium spinosum TaxID=2736 RepID=UPI0001745347|nr:multidrug efflux SMR transporter [Verrucomicrobium spinosum]